jgi:hypothetical protein
MAQAERTFITRRRLMAASAALVPAASVPLSLPAHTSQDPIFAAIDGHARAYADVLVCLEAQSAAERAVWEATDATRAACQARLDEVMAAEGPLGLAEIEASQRLIATTPATLSGAVTVLRYVRELFEREKYALCEDDGYRTLLYSTERAILAGIERT